MCDTIHILVSRGCKLAQQPEPKLALPNCIPIMHTRSLLHVKAYFFPPHSREFIVNLLHHADLPQLHHPWVLAHLTVICYCLKTLVSSSAGLQQDQKKLAVVLTLVKDNTLHFPKSTCCSFPPAKEHQRIKKRALEDTRLNFCHHNITIWWLCLISISAC